MEGSPRSSRAARTLRGSIGALAATLIAAASHSLAGGDITWLAVVATVLLSLPLCVLLAGRVASLWRLSLAVGGSQLLYHWSFAGLGASSAGAGVGASASVSASASASADAAPLHAAHLAALQSFAPTATAGPDAVMWAGHAVAAALTVAVLHRGERGLLTLLTLVRRALPLAIPRALPVRGRVRALPAVSDSVTELRDRLLVSGITHRGPPLAA